MRFVQELVSRVRFKSDKERSRVPTTKQRSVALRRTLKKRSSKKPFTPVFHPLSKTNGIANRGLWLGVARATSAAQHSMRNAPRSSNSQRHASGAPSVTTSRDRLMSRQSPSHVETGFQHPIWETTRFEIRTCTREHVNGFPRRNTLRDSNTLFESQSPPRLHPLLGKHQQSGLTGRRANAARPDSPCARDAPSSSAARAANSLQQSRDFLRIRKISSTLSLSLETHTHTLVRDKRTHERGTYTKARKETPSSL